MRKRTGQAVAFLLGIALSITVIVLAAATHAKNSAGMEGPVPVYPTNAKANPMESPRTTISMTPI